MAAKRTVLEKKDTRARQTSKQGQLVHKPFLAKFFGTTLEKPQLFDENLADEVLEMSNKNFLEKYNILNALKCSFQKETNNWNHERQELHRIINVLSQNSTHDYFAMKMERNQTDKQKIEIEMTSSIIHNRYIKAKEQAINLEIENNKLKLHLAAVDQATKDFISSRFQDSLATISPSPSINTIQQKNTVVKNNAINCSPKSCSSCDNLKCQIESLGQIIDSQKERILERNAKIKVLELGTKKPTLLRTNVLKSKSRSISLNDEKVNVNAFEENSRPNEHFKIRGPVVEDFKKAISYPLPHKFPVNLSLNDFIDRYSSMEAGETKEDVEVRVSGQVHAIRPSGAKLIFYDLRDAGAKVQIMATAIKYNGSDTVFFKDTEKLKKDDVIGVVGYPSKTKKGILSVIPTKLVLLAVLEFGTEKPTLLRNNVLKSKSRSISLDDEKVNVNTVEKNSRPNEHFKIRGPVRWSWQNQKWEPVCDTN